MNRNPFLENQTVVITGANGALGRTLVHACLSRGARVVGVDLQFDDTPPVTQERRLVLDLTNNEQTVAGLSSLDAVDVLFNVAGGFEMGEPAHHAQAQWLSMFNLNVDTLRHATGAVVPLMKRQGGGCIVNVGALSARDGLGGMSAYCAAKSAVMRLTESLSRELRDEGIRVNAVLPGILDTPRNRAEMPSADFSRWVSCAALTDVMLFLASDAARAMHGALVPVSGLG